jgi:hypothetical protein
MSDNTPPQSGSSPNLSRFYSVVATLAPILAFLFVALAFVTILSSVFWPYVFHTPMGLDKTLLQQLSDVETARGLITFLVAVSTVGIALILIVWVASTTLSDAVVKDRSAFSKEVMTSLIGILGTIIGFYFGATQLSGTAGHGAAQALTLASFSTTPAKPAKGETLTVHATVTGGQSPYSYTIRFRFTPDTMKEISGSTPNGTINQAIIDAYDPAKPLDIILEVTDSAGVISGNRLHFPAMP